MRETAVLFLTHGFAPWVAHRFARIARETAGYADCYVLMHDDHGRARDAWAAFLDAAGHRGALVTFDGASLAQSLGYPYFTLRGHVLGSAHLPMMPFVRETSYARYWRVEYDVEYRGSWRELLACFDDCDAALLASHVREFAQAPAWSHWKTLRAPHRAVPPQEMLKAFFPISRFDRAALSLVDDAHLNGWMGHFEVLVPTVLRRSGAKVLDLREHAPCYAPGRQGPAKANEIQSTMRWRPDVRRGEFATRGVGPLLFHPVKGPWFFDGRKLVGWEAGTAGAAAAAGAQAPVSRM